MEITAADYLSKNNTTNTSDTQTFSRMSTARQLGSITEDLEVARFHAIKNSGGFEYTDLGLLMNETSPSPDDKDATAANNITFDLATTTLSQSTTESPSDFESNYHQDGNVHAPKFKLPTILSNAVCVYDQSGIVWTFYLNVSVFRRMIWRVIHLLCWSPII